MRRVDPAREFRAIVVAHREHEVGRLDVPQLVVEHAEFVAAESTAAQPQALRLVRTPCGDECDVVLDQDAQQPCAGRRQVVRHVRVLDLDHIEGTSIELELDLVEHRLRPEALGRLGEGALAASVQVARDEHRLAA